VDAWACFNTTCTDKKQAVVCFFQASQGRTTVIVAHRLSTIRNADKIVVLNGGYVVEQGTHNELMKVHGHYYELVTAQLSSDMEVHAKFKGKMTFYIGSYPKLILAHRKIEHGS